MRVPVVILPAKLVIRGELKYSEDTVGRGSNEVRKDAYLVRVLTSGVRLPRPPDPGPPNTGTGVERFTG